MEQMGEWASSAIMNIVLMTASVMSGDSRSALVYGTLSILSFITFCQAYNMNGSVTVTGDKGTARIEVEGAGDAAISEGGSNSKNSMTGESWHNYFNDTYEQIMLHGKVHLFRIFPRPAINILKNIFMHPGKVGNVVIPI